MPPKSDNEPTPRGGTNRLKTPVGVELRLFGWFNGTQQGVEGVVGLAQGKEAVGDVVEGEPGGFEAIGESIEDFSHCEAAREAVVAGHTIVGAAQAFVVFQIGKPASFGA